MAVESRSLVIAQDDNLTSFGNLNAKIKLLDSLSRWVRLEMSGSVHLNLKVYPKTYPLTEFRTGWILERNGSVFIWKLS
ncbi:hypothetical protein [Dyadobacter sp. NIV53]|uniref:hypothetical protein n=1 Tax=Dyadobacter sp. NIV53 TaxID=2861765 RepID=UPI001C88B723|nr:hypothetical protein [Dyadobacter sp. NIV53]